MTRFDPATPRRAAATAAPSTSRKVVGIVICKHCHAKNDRSPSDYEMSQDVSQSEEEKVASQMDHCLFTVVAWLNSDCIRLLLCLRVQVESEQRCIARLHEGVKIRFTTKLISSAKKHILTCIWPSLSTNHYVVSFYSTTETTCQLATDISCQLLWWANSWTCTMQRTHTWLSDRSFLAAR